MAAGFTALFGAPLGGAVFALEIASLVGFFLAPKAPLIASQLKTQKEIEA
jgi:H+/Cl- antiporter ClcA